MDYLIKPILFILRHKKKEPISWRDLSVDEMVLPYKDVNNQKKIEIKKLILSLILNALFFFFKFKKISKKTNKKKVSGNYYPIN